MFLTVLTRRDRNDSIAGASRVDDILEIEEDLGSAGPYLLRDESFAADVLNSYAVDTSAVTVIPAVMPSVVVGGLKFTGTSLGQETVVFLGDDGSLYISDDAPSDFSVYFADGVTTLQDIVDHVAANGAGITLVELAPGASGTDLAVAGTGTLSGGSPETSEPTPVTVTLPASPTEGQYIDLADARGTWGSNPLTVLRNGHKIEGVEADFVNNASGTFFRLLYVDSAIGWRVLASGTKPLNLTAPTITGSPYVGATLTAGNGTWTGSPTSFSYQWQSSADAGETWSDIGGATSQAYALTSGEDGKIVRVQVIATNANGPSVAVASLPTEEITVPAFPTGGLLAFWKLSDLTDASGNGLTLTNNNGVTFGAGKLGNAAELDGSNNLTVTPSSVMLENGLTISLWVSPTGSGVQVGVGFYVGGNAVYAAWFVNGTAFGDLGHGTDAYSTSENGDVLSGQWNHVVYRADPVNETWTVAVNGVIVTRALPGSFNSASTIGTINIGSNRDGVSGEPVHGKIDAVGIWNRALTDLEIAQLFNSGAGLEHP